MRLGALLIRFLPAAGLLAASAARAQVNAPEVEMANLKEDLSGLNQRVGDLSLRVEQLEHDNGALRQRLQSQGASPVEGAVTPAQLNAAVADLNASIHAAVAASRSEILQRVGTQMEALARQTDAALDSIDKGAASRTPVRAPGHDDAEDSASAAGASDTPVPTSAAREAAAAAVPGPAGPGTRYTVQKGDTLAAIARKTGGGVRAIIEANKLADPSRIRVGQTLLIPGGN